MEPGRAVVRSLTGSRAVLQRPNLSMAILNLNDGTMPTLEKNLVVEMKLTTCRIRRNVQLGCISQGEKILVACLTVAEVGTFVGVLLNSGYSASWTVVGYHSKLSIE